LADSHRLDPATGTLLALALCHEKEGLLASAWAEFTEVQGRAHRDGRQDREKVAKEHAAALRPRLSTLLIEVPAAVATISGLELRRNGAPLGRGSWNVAVPVDGGKFTISAAAPGRRTWEGSVVVKSESDPARVIVPAPAEEPKKAAILARPAATPTGEKNPSATERTETARPWGALEWGGTAMVGAGAISLGVGGYFLASALAHKKAAEPYCRDGVHCDDPGLAERAMAVRRGNVATVLGVVGGTLATAGLITIVIGRSKASTSEAAFSASFGTLPGGFAGSVGGTF